jgi:branched-chain amino acid transport system substrate-binding protein
MARDDGDGSPADRSGDDAPAPWPEALVPPPLPNPAAALPPASWPEDSAGPEDSPWPEDSAGPEDSPWPDDSPWPEDTAGPGGPAEPPPPPGRVTTQAWLPPERLGRRWPVVVVVVALAVVVGAGTLAAAWAVAPAAAPRVGAASPATSPAASPPVAGEVLTIGISLPMQGDLRGTTEPIRAGVQLAVDEANAEGLVPGVTIRTRLLDHGAGGGPDTSQAATDMRAFVDDPTVVGVVGPYHDDAAAAQIPVSNAAGLLQCSPSNMTAGLTIGPDAARLRPVPERVSYVRVQAPDEREGAALAEYAWDTLGLRHAAVGDDRSSWGTALANTFTAAWAARGGSVNLRFHSDGDGSLSDIDVGRIGGPGIDLVMFGGLTDTGAADLRVAMDAAGLRDRWLLLGNDSLDGGATVDGSFASRVTGQWDMPGPTAGADAYRSAFPGDEGFYARMERATGVDPDYYGPAGYACAEAILEGIRVSRATGAVTREGVRAAVTRAGAAYDGVFGRTSFDARGDVVPSAITIYRLAREDGGEVDWAWDAQLELDGP